MFDIGFSELFVCAVIALIVLGPERLPGLARTLGRWSGQARAYMRNLTAEIEREVKVQELRKQVEEANRGLREHTAAAKAEVRKLAEGTERAARIEPPADGNPTPAEADQAQNRAPPAT